MISYARMWRHLVPSTIVPRHPASIPPPPPTVTVIPRRTKYQGEHNFPYRNRLDAGVTRRTRPYLHGDSSELDFKVEGVSDKQFPIMLQWERPKHVQRWEPSPDGSGDCDGLPDVDMSLPRLQFDGLEELKDAPDVVRKVLSLEYGRNRDLIERVGDEMVRGVQRHAQDFSSVEVTIAQMTVSIRRWQKILVDIRPRENFPLKHAVKMKVDDRRCLLRRLREQDYKRYEWLLEKLDLVYKPRPFFWERIMRKKHLTRLTELWCDELKHFRLEEMRRQLQAKQPGYLREKADNLRFIMKEEQELGLPRTVKEEDVKECLDRATEIETRCKEEEAKPGKEFFVFQPEVKEDYHKYLG